MYWKMSMDLQRPLVRSEGNLDPVDGLATCKLLQQTDGEESRVLEEEIKDYEKIVRTKWKGYTSDDPLDLGMTLWTAHWLQDEEWAATLVEAAKRDLKVVIDSGYFDRDVDRRLAFREFGTCLGIRCALGQPDWDKEAERIIAAWEETGVVPVPQGRGGGGINLLDELQPITLVMYAAALNPGVFKRDWQCRSRNQARGSVIVYGDIYALYDVAILNVWEIRN